MRVLTAQNITKVFPGTVALDDVTVSFVSGKVNALVGKNGSGKSTLVKIINGAQDATSGEILMDGQKLDISDPKDAFNKGIATVYQEMSLVPGMSVAENILMGRFEKRGKFIDWAKTYEKAGALLEELGIDISPKEMVYNLSVWQSQMVEIAKAMSYNPKVILLDEPTSALAQSQTQILFKQIREMKKKDVIIIYISHRLQELWEIADTCTVLRDGKYVGMLEMETATHKDLLAMMFGETKVRPRPEWLKHGEEVVMKVEGLTHDPAFRNVNFELKKGEVLGIAGMLGSGRTELLNTIFGSDPRDSGSVKVYDKSYNKADPVMMKRAGLALTPEDRKHSGLVQIHNIKDNLNIASLDKINKGLFIDAKSELEAASKQVKDLEIKIAGLDVEVSSLSGGNQQKVVVGKWLNTSPRIMLFDEPSRGIDVNAKQQIFEIIWSLSQKGISSIVVSSELEELLEICHRILIMREGEIRGEVNPDDYKIEDLYALCMGGTIA